MKNYIKKFYSIVVAITFSMALSITPAHSMMNNNPTTPNVMSTAQIIELITGLLRLPLASLAASAELEGNESAAAYGAMANGMRTINLALSIFNHPWKDASDVFTNGSVGYDITWITIDTGFLIDQVNTALEQLPEGYIHAPVADVSSALYATRVVILPCIEAICSAGVAYWNSNPSKEARKYCSVFRSCRSLARIVDYLVMTEEHSDKNAFLMVVLATNAMMLLVHLIPEETTCPRCHRYHNCLWCDPHCCTCPYNGFRHTTCLFCHNDYCTCGHRNHSIYVEPIRFETTRYNTFNRNTTPAFQPGVYQHPPRPTSFTMPRNNTHTFNNVQQAPPRAFGSADTLSRNFHAQHPNVPHL